MDPIIEPEIWEVSNHDRKVFLRSVKLHHCTNNDMLRQQKKKSKAAQKCMKTLHSVVESLQHNHVMITDNIAFHKGLWDTKLYDDDPTEFPVSHVPIKCNIISTVIELLRNYTSGNPSVDSKEKIGIIFRYLEKLLDATKFTTQTQIDTSLCPPKTSSDPAPTKRWSAQSIFSSVKRSNSRSRSKQNISAPKTAQLPTDTLTSSRMSISTSASSAASIRSTLTTSTTNSLSQRIPHDTHLKRPLVSRENLNKFQEYKPLIIALYHRLKILDEAEIKKEFIFQFIDDIVCSFIIDDCKTILLDYIEHKIIQLQEQEQLCI